MQFDKWPFAGFEGQTNDQIAPHGRDKSERKKTPMCDCEVWVKLSENLGGLVHMLSLDEPLVRLTVSPLEDPLRGHSPRK
jgi:hypothetical protein